MKSRSMRKILDIYLSKLPQQTIQKLKFNNVNPHYGQVQRERDEDELERYQEILEQEALQRTPGETVEEGMIQTGGSKTHKQIEVKN